MTHPFSETQLTERVRIRSFSASTPAEDLVWHRDDEHRLLRVHESRGWYLQFDGELPQPLRVGSVHFIPRERWHRVIRRSGASRLTLEVAGFSDAELPVLSEALKKGDRVKHQGDEATVKVPDGRGDLVGIDPSGPEDMEMVPEDELEPLAEKDKKSNHPGQYGAPEGSKRDKQLDATQRDLKRAKELRKDGKAKQAKELEQKAYRRREKMEKSARSESGWKNKPRSDTKKESVRMSESELRAIVDEVLEEELSKKTKATLRKKAEERGFTPGSVEAEYKKGLAAWATSGSRKGMTQHQWAMARVNSATPSKSWAVVKKSKAKKKK